MKETNILMGRKPMKTDELINQISNIVLAEDRTVEMRMIDNTRRFMLLAERDALFVYIVPPSITFEQFPYYDDFHAGMSLMLMQEISVLISGDNFDGLRVRLSDGTVRRDYIIEELAAPTDESELIGLFTKPVRELWITEPDRVNRLLEGAVVRG